MTTDAFTEAALESAASKYQGDWDPFEQDPVDDCGLSESERQAHIAGWKAARDYLAQQEPTEEEVEAAAIEAYEMERADIDPAWPDWQDAGPLSRDSTRAMVRAIFREAKEARR